MSSRSVIFSATAAATQTHAIPANVFGGQISFDIRGAAGGDIFGYGQQGFGGRVTGGWLVAPGDVITAYVAFGGQNAYGNVFNAGGWGYHSGGNGGPIGTGQSAGAGGGGSTAILDGATFIAEAGGGGGSDSFVNPGPQTGGNGGALPSGGGTGTPGANGAGASSTAEGAGGAAQGFGATNGFPGSAGAGGTGGAAGASGAHVGFGGGGGGGGTHGGGGGGGGPGNIAPLGIWNNQGGGGGGGLSTAAPAVLFPAYNDGYQSGAGQVVLSYSVMPVVALTAPTGTLTTTAEPFLVYTYSQLDGHSQVLYEAMVYADPASGWPAGFDPATGIYPGGTLTPAWSARVPISFLSAGIPVTSPLPNGPYHAFVRVKDSDPGGVVSLWAQTAWTQAVPGPTPPGLVVTPDPQNARVHVQLSSRDNLLPTVDDASFEGGVGDWQATLNCSIAQAPVGLEGPHSLLITPTAAGNLNAQTAAPAYVRVTPGQSYVASFWTLGAAGGTVRAVSAQIQWFTAGGVFVSNSSGPPVNDSLATWTQTFTVGQAPPSATQALVVVQYVAGSAADRIYIDRAAVFPGSNPAAIWLLPAPATQTWEVQRTSDGGATWLDVLFMGALAFPPAGATDAYDREAPRECALYYRARGTGTVTGLTVVGDWAIASCRLASDGNEWLTCLGDASLDGPVIRQGPDLAGGSHEDQAAYWPDGQAPATVVEGTIHAESFGVAGAGGTGLTLAFGSDAAWGRFLALRARREPVLLRTVYGDQPGPLEQFWLRFGADVATTRKGGPYVLNRAGQIRQAAVPAVVVSRPVRP